MVTNETKKHAIVYHKRNPNPEKYPEETDYENDWNIEEEINEEGEQEIEEEINEEGEQEI